MDQHTKKQAVILIGLVACLGMVGLRAFGGGGSIDDAALGGPSSELGVDDGTPIEDGDRPLRRDPLRRTETVAHYRMVSAGAPDPLAGAPPRYDGDDSPIEEMLTIRSIRYLGDRWMVRLNEVRGFRGDGDTFTFMGETYRVLEISRGGVEIENDVTGDRYELLRGRHRRTRNRDGNR